ncbi:class I SAM-dependent methyltransferase [Cyanobacterium aponinum FACHB-4101]|uniref:class I SAM-dependent methyltransferase n=1 Tax=Cyanobacterium aponinum TaxID=379064 RepID=UPI00168027A4|nr:class I SAM-dependent methyltransferase [Cyanobacterium aponinum]MBD2395645.1 class I SAM-dependent methyltransferase [Cyanobacterium aponinum FACHB-4101]
MNQSSQDLLQQQYDSLPYPKMPLEKSPNQNYNSLFVKNLITSFYLCHQKVIDTTNKAILDVGCGSGWTTLNLAFANPNAKIIAIDLSQNSLEVAKKRLEYHQFSNVEFHQMAMENIGELNYQYDYINAEDVLYFCPQPIESLMALKSVLKSDGIIRANFHSYYQRFYYYLSQELFHCLGLFDNNPEDFEIDIVAETMQNLHPNTILKRYAGGIFNKGNADLSSEKTKENILMNYLIQNDKGYTIPQVFEILQASGLQFLAMTNWRQWEIRDLFKDRNSIPTAWEFVLENASEEEKLHLFELINPRHRLIDFWCVGENTISAIQPLSTWTDNDWFNAKIYLHPQLKSTEIKEDLLKTIKEQNYWEISKYITLPSLAPITISGHLSAVLLPLWNHSQTLEELVSYWLKIQPKNLITSEYKSRDEATQEIKDLIIKLETFLYLLVEK